MLEPSVTGVVKADDSSAAGRETQSCADGACAGAPGSRRRSDQELVQLEGLDCRICLWAICQHKVQLFQEADMSRQAPYAFQPKLVPNRFMDMVFCQCVACQSFHNSDMPNRELVHLRTIHDKNPASAWRGLHFGTNILFSWGREDIRVPVGPGIAPQHAAG